MVRSFRGDGKIESIRIRRARCICVCNVLTSAGLNLNPAIWEAIAGTGRIDCADMGRSGAAPLHIL